MKIAFYTLGCKVNQYETQALKEKFTDRGYEIVGEQEFADVYIINTCTVTGLADRKSRQYIRRIKKMNPDSVTAVIGCYVQVNPEEAKSIEGVNIVAGTNEKNQLPEYVEAFLAERAYNEKEMTRDYKPSQICHIKEYEELTGYEETGSITSLESRKRAYIKVQEGCNQFCSYCIIPYARGAVRSRAREDIVKEAENLISKGFKELVLTGINTALYGTENGFTSEKTLKDGSRDEPDQVYGIEIIVKLLDQLPGDFRIRLGSLEPTVINASYVRRLLQYKKLCHHMHLSLQSGSDRVLSLMNRHYDSYGYCEIVKVLREFDMGYGLTTDIIVGFPGETDVDFRDSVQMVKQIGFNKVHVFPFSKRQGTRAAEMAAQIPSEIKKLRSTELTKESKTASREFLQSIMGSVRQVLFEEYDESTGYISGFSDNYIKVYCRITEHTQVDNFLNQFADVVFLEIYNEGVSGKLCEKSMPQ